MISEKEIVKRVKEALRNEPVSRDHRFRRFNRAKIGLPRIVYAPSGDPAFWLVPLLQADFACGFARVELSGGVSKLGIFGSAFDDKRSWIANAFFREPPQNALSEIKEKYHNHKLSEPIFSYDKSQDKWAWKINAKSKDGTERDIFIGPNQWYEQPSFTEESDREG